MTKLRFHDRWTRSTTLLYTVREMLESFETPYQKIDLFEAEDWGTVLCLGGVTNVTDRDESSYHEMLAHVPLFAHPNPRRVLIIGGGDGGTLREVLRHDAVEEAVLVDIDAEVIRIAREYFPALSSSFDDPRAEVIVGDGLAYIENAAANGVSFDVILIDSTDPVDAAVELFTEGFYRSCAKVLGEGGILVPQSDSPTFCMDRVRKIHALLGSIFAHTSPYLGQTLAYPGGMWAFIGASNGVHLQTALKDPAVLERIAVLDDALRYFNSDLAPACFALPSYVRRGLTGEAFDGLPSLSDDPNAG